MGAELTPHYHKMLPPAINTWKDHNQNLGDGIEWSQQRGENMGDLVWEMLEAMEVHGSDEAFMNIRLVVPSYQSCF